MNKNSALVVGGGVAGMQTAIDLASMGINVYLVEKEPRLGGHTPLLHQVFPTLENAEESTKQLLQKVLNNPNIRVLSHAEIESVAGSMGNFRVYISKKARYVDEVKCTNCGECEKVCPVDVPKKFEMGLATRKAIYLPKPFAVPARYIIDEEACVYFKDKSCRACQDACPERAVLYDEKPLHEELSVGAIVLATGFCQYDVQKVGQYKYGVYPNVITGMEYERLCSPKGPTGGKILRIDNEERPKGIAFILCVGSRDERHLRYCCNIGCLNALKHAYYLKKQYGEEVDAYICYTDIRAVTKQGEQLYQKVRASGVEFIHGQPSEVRQTPNGLLILDVYDLATTKLLSITADLVVLETGLKPQVNLKEKLKLPLDEDCFFLEKHPQLAPNETTRDGIFLAGAVQQPMHVYETLISASAVAMKVSSFMRSSPASH
ncbi:MAG: CoB--CoM heterodisulfide reductase iron-sulfur subunit A family protein [Candidatus Bathyarchaeia archaeon]|nr:CoB--CoM heterodisulfide reductase iron-sulfur subunit A family protein [Candidatus Bathyarchaeia archaeon]